MPAGSIIIDLLMRTGAFETDTDRAAKKLKQLQKDVQGLAADFGVGALSIGGATTALIAWTKATADGIDALNDFADATGTTVENASALEDVALRTGAGLETAQSVLIKFNQVLKDTKAGSDAAAIIKQIGLEAEALKGLDPAEALRQVAVALAQFADDGAKARVVQELFGKSVKEAAPFLKDLAEQGALVAKVTKEDAEAAEAFNKQITSLQKDVIDLSRTALTPLISAMAEVGNSFRQAKAEGKGFWDAQIEAYGKWSRQFITGRLTGRLILGDEESTGGATGSFGDGDKPSLLRNRQQMGIGGGGGVDWNIIEENRKKDEAAARAAISRAQESVRAAESYIKSLKNQLMAVNDLTEVEKFREALASGAAGKMTAAQQKQALALATEIDMRKALESQLKAEAQQKQDLIEWDKKQADEAKRLWESVETPIETLNRTLIENEDLVRRNPLVNGELKDRLDAEAWKRFADAVKDTGKEMDDFAKNAAENIQRHLGDTFYDAMQGNFDNIGSSFKQMLDRMVAEALAANIARKLFGGMVEGGSGEGWAGTALKAIGTWFGFGGAKAGGGDVTPNDAYLIGEKGPEMFVPRTAGTIIPAAATAGAGGGKQIVFNNNQYFAPGTDRRTTAQAAGDAQRALSLATRNA